MDPLILAILVMAFLTVTVILLSLHHLKEGHVMIVERLGGFYKIIDQPGSYFLFPMIDRAIEMVNIRKQKRTLTIQDSNHPSVEPITLEYTFQITDAKLFVYASVNSLKTFESQIRDTWNRYRILDSDQLDELSEIAIHLGIQLLEISIQ